jgi:hypothetical protein
VIALHREDPGCDSAVLVELLFWATLYGKFQEGYRGRYTIEIVGKNPKQSVAV